MVSTNLFAGEYFAGDSEGVTDKDLDLAFGEREAQRSDCETTENQELERMENSLSRVAVCLVRLKLERKDQGSSAV